MNPLLLLTFLVFFTSIVLLVVALRGRRIDDHPICRKCRYDLFALPSDSLLCPECGADLCRKRAIRVGHRRKLKPLLVLCLFLILPSFTYLAHTGYITARSTDPNPYKPLWWLMRDIETGGPALQQAALHELRARWTDGRVSDQKLAQILDKALAIQADQSILWDPIWGNLVELAQSDGKLSSERWDRYLHNAIPFYLVARPKVRRGASVPLELRSHPTRAAFRVLQGVRCTVMTLEVDGDDCRPPTFGTDFGWPRGATAESRLFFARSDHPTMLELQPGLHTARLKLNLGFYGGRQTAGMSRGWGAAMQTPDHYVPVSVDAKWEHVEVSTVSIAEPPGEAERTNIQSLFTVSPFSGRAYGPAPDDVSVHIDWPGHPTHQLAFEVFARSGQKQWPIGWIQIPLGRPYTGYLHRNLPEYDPGPFDIVFKPSIQAAETTVDLTHIWGGEIIFRNIPRPQPSDAPQR